MPLFTIDQEKCNKDGLCAVECPAGCIEFVEGELPVPHEKKQAYCLNCGHCMAVCPTGAIRLERLPGPAQRRDRSLNLTYDQAEQFLKGRRSVRAFKDEPVDRELLEDILSVTGYGPSGHNARQTKWAVAPAAGMVSQVAKATAEWMRREVDAESPLAAKLHLPGIVKAWDNGLDMICRHAPALAVAYGPKVGVTPREDAVIAITYLELAATAAGLGACWCGYVTAAATFDSELCDILGVPEDSAVYGALMLGKAVRRYKSIPPRPEPDVKWLY